jgi:negative regulator of sigma E activity
MNEDAPDISRHAFEERSQRLFRDSVADVDMRIRSRLTQARYAALDAAAVSKRRPWFARLPTWTPAAGVTAAVMLAAALWFALPAGHGPASADVQPNLEDLEMVAATEEGSGDALEMLQNDLDFYDFVDKAAGAGPAA